MKLIIGLGNPGQEYEKTRHNIGFMALEGIRDQVSGFSNWKLEKRLESKVCRGHIASCCEDVILAKPQTFMNNSGGTVKKLIANYQLLITDLLVIHDDLDLPLGALRLSLGSGSAGHNGVQSIIATLCTKDFWRLRIGISPRPQSPSLKTCLPTRQVREGRESYDNASDFVLKNFSRAEAPKLKKALALTAHAVQMMFELGPSHAQTEINKT